MAETGDEARIDTLVKAHAASPPCDVCGGPTYEVRCEIVCGRCGFTRDCSDP